MCAVMAYFLDTLAWEMVMCIICHNIATEFADRHNTALVCHRWRYLACHPRLWLRVDRSAKDSSEPGVFTNIESAVSAARSENCIFLMRYL